MEQRKRNLTVDTLSAEQIDLLSERLAEILSEEIKLEHKEVLRLRLSVEEALLVWREELGKDHPVSLRYGKRLGRPFVELSLRGNSSNPYEQKDGEMLNSQGAQNMLSFYGLAPSYSYEKGVNLLTLMPRRKKPGTIVRMISAFVLAIFTGLGCAMLPDSFNAALTGSLLQPIFNTFMGLLSAMAGPLIFLSVLWGIYSMGDVATLGKIGKKMIARFLIVTAIVAAFTTVGSYWMYDLNFSSSGGGSGQVSEIVNMLLDIIPGNLVEPFLTGNSLQIISLAVMVGLAMLILRDKTTVAAQFVEQVNFIVQLIMDVIGSLVPFTIFVSVLNMMLTGALGTILDSVKSAVICCVFSVLVLLVYGVVVCVTKKIPFGLLLNKLLPTMIIAVTTSSSAAAFGTNVETCERKLGIDKRVVNFGLPTGQVVFMPGAVVLFLSMCLAMAELYAVPVSVSWLITAAIVTSLLAIAAPPIPGGALSCYTVMFLQLGIPAEAVVVAIALNTVLEFVATMTNLSSLQMELVLLADGLDMLDKDILRK